LDNGTVKFLAAVMPNDSARFLVTAAAARGIRRILGWGQCPLAS